MDRAGISKKVMKEETSSLFLMGTECCTVPVHVRSLVLNV